MCILLFHQMALEQTITHSPFILGFEGAQPLSKSTTQCVQVLGEQGYRPQRSHTQPVCFSGQKMRRTWPFTSFNSPKRETALSVTLHQRTEDYRLASKDNSTQVHRYSAAGFGAQSHVSWILRPTSPFIVNRC